MKTSTHKESTYALLVRSEEKERNASEAIVYTLLILSAVFSIWQAAHQPIVVPQTVSGYANVPAQVQRGV